MLAGDKPDLQEGHAHRHFKHTRSSRLHQKPFSLSLKLDLMMPAHCLHKFCKYDGFAGVSAFLSLDVSTVSKTFQSFDGLVQALIEVLDETAQ